MLFEVGKKGSVREVLKVGGIVSHDVGASGDEGVCCGDRLNWQFVAGVRCKRLDERSDPALALTSSFFDSFVRLFVASNRQPTYIADPHFLAGLARPDGGESQGERV